MKATPRDPAAPRARVALRVIRPGAPPPAARSEAALTTTQRIVDSITTAIVERRLMPGTKLAEQKLADIFDVSRTLVRQALNQLSRDRLVLLRAGARRLRGDAERRARRARCSRCAR